MREESPTDVPNVNIAQSMEAAAAAVPATEPEEDDHLDAMTVGPCTIKWMTMPYEVMQELFRTGSRYDAMGNWPGPLCTTDPETNVSREISDEEIQVSNAHAGGELEDPDRRWL